MATQVPVSMGTLVGPSGIDPRNSLDQHGQDIQMMNANTIDPTINQQPLDVYFHWANIERAREDADLTVDEGSPYTRIFHRIIGTKKQTNVSAAALAEPHENQLEKGEKKESTGAVFITESERFHAYRALRTASWQGVFFLITTDILGPSSAPYALDLLGYGGGILVYFFFYVMAFFAGQALWRMYMDMDSSRYPIKCFADLGERLLGRTFRHICNIIQSFQLLLNVGLLIQGNGVTLASLINYKFCFIVLNLLWMLTGMIGGQIKSLRNFAWFANLNVWLNVVVIFMAIVGCAVYAPVPTLNFPTLAAPYPAVHHTGFAPAGSGWYLQVAGVQYAVFAYGGAMIFVEFMAEMRRPRDFWKSAFIAQTFIFTCYLLYGLVIYGFQGQYSYIIPTLSIDNTKFLLAVNIIGLFTTMVAAVLYGNIGVKIFYFNILQAYFKAPDLQSPGGRVGWIITVLAYWSFAFIFASAIPQISAFVTLVGALCILQFTYTFPPLMWCAYMMHKDAIKGDREWEPGMVPGSNRIDTWKESSRWKRAFAPLWYVKVFLIVLFLAALALCGLGAYAGVEQIIAAYQVQGHATSFGCRAPGQPADIPTPV